jgi:hypothetical protein
VAKKQGDLIITEAEDFFGDPFFMRMLVKDAEVAKPFVDTGWTPTVAVAAEDELMPVCVVWTRMTSHLYVKFGPSRFRDHATILSRAGGVTQRLMCNVTTIADEMGEQDDSCFRPYYGVPRFRNSPRQGDAVANLKSLDTLPT